MRKKVNLQSTKSGFTIIEVSLAMSFIAVLLIVIALTISGIMTTFQKGITLKSVNTVGRNLISEFTTAVNLAPSVDSTSLCNVYATGNTDECIRDGAFNYIFQERVGTARDTATGEQVDGVQYFGLLCTGKYTYAWNTYYGIEAGQYISLRYNPGGGTLTIPETPDDQDTIFRLIRFEDTTYNACTQNVDSNYNIKADFKSPTAARPVIDMTTLANQAPVQLATPQEGFLESSESDINLDLYEFVIFPISQDTVTLRSFFSGTFILATNNGDVNIVRTGDYCDPSSAGYAEGQTSSQLNLGSGFNYCGINRFNFAARTAGNNV